MEIQVTRGPSFQGATIGELSIDGVFECYTLEDEVREPKERCLSSLWSTLCDWVRSWKVDGKTAIPRGRYQVIVNMSNRFKRLMPLLEAVAGFVGVRIHPGNDSADTEGCILVGQTKEANLIYKSRAAFEALFPKIQAALAAGQEVWITVA